MTDRPDCEALRAVAAELALGTLEGAERGEALAHLADCPACRSLVQELAVVVDHLVAAAPEAEPPAGFESAVIARIRTEERPTVTRLPRRRVLAAVAAAGLLLLGGLGVGLFVGRDADQAGSELASAPMTAPGGDVVGEVWRYGVEDAVLFVSVPAWGDVAFAGPQAMSYALRLELAGGDTQDVGEFTLGGGRSSWGVTTEVDGPEIAAVSVIDETGHVWCTGRFPEGA